MNILKAIGGRIWALWGLVSFAVTFLIIFIPSMLTWLIPNPQGQRVFIWIARLWMNVWLRLVGCPAKVSGKEYFVKGESYIVTCNHNSLMDVPLSAPYIPGANKTIAKSSFVKVPLFGLFYAKGSVLVNRKDEKSRRESFDKMKAVLKAGMHMSIYPEGTRNRSTEPMKKFHDGAFRLAVDSGKSVIPCVIFNTAKALPLKPFFYFRPHRLQIHFLAPISPAGKTTDQLRDEVYHTMRDYYTSRPS
jgi:1-acyl-sn-glycerol-3-phosphate acyltransferase